jgi:citrate lyase subunit beta/citryl-CoA lyase
VRVNAISSGLVRDDLMATAVKGLRAVVLPKAAGPQDVRDLDVLLREAEVSNGVRPGDIGVIPLIESAGGLLRCEAIATATDRVVGLALGGEDYTFDIGAPRGPEALHHIRATIVQVAAAYGLLSIDTPYPDLRDADGLSEEARLARSIGLKGKFAIHPDQVSTINRAFAPTVDEIEQARRIVEAFDAAYRDGAGAISVDGRMVDAPIAERARAVIAASRRRR